MPAMAVVALRRPPSPVTAMAAVTAVALVAFGRGGLGGDHPRGEQRRGYDERRHQFDPSCHVVELLPFGVPFADPVPVRARRPRIRAAQLTPAGTLKIGTTVYCRHQRPRTAVESGAGEFPCQILWVSPLNIVRLQVKRWL